jgi:hypothetical protein
MVETKRTEITTTKGALVLLQSILPLVYKKESHIVIFLNQISVTILINLDNKKDEELAPSPTSAKSGVVPTIGGRPCGLSRCKGTLGPPDRVWSLGPPTNREQGHCSTL